MLFPASNKIKSLNFRAFEGLPKIRYVSLKDNVCIDNNFLDAEIISKELPVALENCSFGDSFRPATKDLIVVLPRSKQKPLSCEEITKSEFISGTNCHMANTTMINHDDTPISVKDLNMTILSFTLNSDVYFLPVAMHKSFPNLQDIDARSCTIREISKKNFEHLQELRELRLDGNFISKIRSNTFEGLSNLKGVELSKNLRLQASFQSLTFFFVLNS